MWDRRARGFGVESVSGARPCACDLAMLSVESEIAGNETYVVDSVADFGTGFRGRIRDMMPPMIRRLVEHELPGIKESRRTMKAS